MSWLGVSTLVLFGLLAGHTLWIYRPCFRALRAHRSDPASGPLPRANVVISLKGADPFLDRCLSGLAKQDYPDYRITIVVDSETDDAYVAAMQAQAQHQNCPIEVVIRDRALPHCSRKISSLLTAIGRMPEDVELVAICDGDAVTNVDWLRELSAGLRDPKVAAVSGNRWYVPPDLSLSAHSRYYWNALAVPAMQRHGIIWGGSLAIRASICREPEFERWIQNAFSEDTGIASYLHATGRVYHSRLAPLLINTESITPAGYWNFLVRQMMAVRLNHPEWRPILIHGLGIGGAMGVLTPVCVLAGVSSALPAVAGLLLYGLILLVVVGLFEVQVRRTLPTHPAFQRPFGLARVVASIGGIATTGVVYPLAVVAGWLTRSHIWRGVHYQVERRRVTIINSAPQIATPIPFPEPAVPSGLQGATLPPRAAAAP